MFVSRSVISDPDQAHDVDLAWLAGLLEGEGSFMVGPPSAPRRPAIQMSMTDGDVVARAAAILGCRVFVIRPRKKHWSVAYGLRLRGLGAVRWMTALRPFLGKRRQGQVDRAVASYQSRSRTKLTCDDAAQALNLLADGDSVSDVAQRFSVSVWCIYDLRLGRTHREIERPTELKRAS